MENWRVPEKKDTPSYVHSPGCGLVSRGSVNSERNTVQNKKGNTKYKNR